MWLSCDLSCDLHLTASLGDKALHKELWHFNQGKWVTLVQSQLYQTSHFSLPSSPPSSPLPRGTTRICSILLSASKRRTSWQTNSVSETFTLHNYTPAPTFYLSPSFPPSSSYFLSWRSPDYYHTCYCLSGLSVAQHCHGNERVIDITHDPDSVLVCPYWDGKI